MMQNRKFCFTEHEVGMPQDMKRRPSYAIASVDHALRIATMLQLEGAVTVSQAAERLGVARSTAHRLLTMLVYRDFAVQDESRVYHAGPVLELAAHSQSATARLRAAALPHLQQLVNVLDESANLIIRTGGSARFIASVECEQSLRVGTREGMVFPAHRVTGGLVLLAELADAQLEALYAEDRYADRPTERPDLAWLRTELATVRANGFAVNEGLSERGVVAVGRAVREQTGAAVAGVSVSMPSVRYDRRHLRSILAALEFTTRAIETDLQAPSG
jgi:DNA-binding IclR family transcriptional regulator